MKTTFAGAATIGTFFLSTLTAAQSKGFNYGSTDGVGACRDEAAFEGLFNSAKTLCGTQNTPISAIQAAIDTDTQLLLGLWASAGDAVFNDEITALRNAINQYGAAFTDRVVGISVGSEDLYRSSPAGVANEAGVGVSADVVIRYIQQVRDTIAGTSLAGAPVGHVDTWTAWVLGENAGVIGAVDWLGHNSFPYFESTLANPIDQAEGVFYNALGATEGVSQGKPVWVTETGWPVSGPTSNLAVASVENAQSYWKQVGCDLFGSRNVWWYTLQDSNANQQEISFGIVGDGVPASNVPLFDVTC
ncbi:hypothetical protein LTS08_007255 [Lithohypha guttulata]|uniref:Probable glucan endo-1,3-beta-glucosidase eglC n=1 Tax=Lithohypha guttulata TaxID=1690604 RepID=A0AAN7Y916_9EURO|nr:hypothetical protein LTR51_002090 [Lithohypha guttulata]KAK5090180.1 hypothetical protein LTR05_000350 [Lithohypha guttulata]KAK5096765.1 hypothetical protein LTS08_007255 [Lithohypha guttulata]